MHSLDEDLASPEFLHGVTQGFWSEPERVGDLVYITLHAPDTRSFLAQLDCSSYWEQPIRCLFVNPQTRKVDLAAWPDGNAEFEKWIKFRANPQFICWDQDRGGIDTGRHTDWQGHKKWQSKENQVAAHLDFLRKMLHLKSNGYNRKK